MTISKAFVDLLQKKGYGVFGENIYLYRVPSSLKTPVELLWVIPSGGYPTQSSITGSAIKTYNFIVRFRSRDAKKVDEVMNDLEAMLNCASCVELEGYDLVGIRATQYPTDDDLDSEDRMIGSISVEVQVYKSCN